MRRRARRSAATRTPESPSSPTRRCPASRARIRPRASRCAGVSSRAAALFSRSHTMEKSTVAGTASAAPVAKTRGHLPPGLTVAAMGPFIALLIACTFFAFQSDRFLTGGNFSLILQQIAVVGVIAIGQTLVILTAGIDLSCGMVMALGSIVMTKLAADMGLPAPLAILAGIAVT